MKAESCPKVLLMGLRRSGKSSILKVVFSKMSPNETLFLESTQKIHREWVQHSSLVRFHVMDFPGQIDFFDPAFDSDQIFANVGALIFVIDAQDDYIEALSRLVLTVSKAHPLNPNISYEIFIHKVDGLSDDHKIETQRDIQQRLTDELIDAGYENVKMSFFLTSIYDHSILEALSKVVQKMIPSLPTLENLLNVFCSHSGIEKAFLFDVYTKLYMATDSSPVDMQSYELCSDMIDVVMDISCIYGLKMCDTDADVKTSDSIQTEITDDDPNHHDDIGPPFVIPFDKKSSALIRLSNSLSLSLFHLTESLALVTLVRGEAAEKRGLMEYNVCCLKDAIDAVTRVVGKERGWDVEQRMTRALTNRPQ